MPSFDIISEVNSHELTNAVDQASRELEIRYDFKGVNATFALNDTEITLEAEADFQLKQLLEILQIKMVKRGINIKCLEKNEAFASGKKMKQTVIVKQGVEKELAKKIVKCVKDSKLKVQSAIQGEKIRVTGKNRDDLQNTMALLKEKEFDLPLQFDNFRD